MLLAKCALTQISGCKRPNVPTQEGENKENYSLSVFEKYVAI